MENRFGNIEGDLIIPSKYPATAEIKHENPLFFQIKNNRLNLDRKNNG
jgi:hypothetical protein